MRTIPIFFALLLVGCATTNEAPVRSARLISRCATPDLCSSVSRPEEMAPEVQTIGGKGKCVDAIEADERLLVPQEATPTSHERPPVERRVLRHHPGNGHS